MLYVGLIAGGILLLYTLIIVRFGDTLFDTDETFKFFVTGFFLLLIITGVVMKFTIPSVQGPADITSLGQIVIDPSVFFATR